MNKELLQEWYFELINKERLNNWYEGYKNTVERVAEYRKKIEEGYRLSVQNDGEFLELLLKNDENGVASKGQSVISNAVYKQLVQNQYFIKIIEQLILVPNLENYNKFRRIGDDLLNQLGSTKRPLLLNRACASCTLNVSSVVDEIKFNKLFKYLCKNNLIETPEVLKDKNWYERNIFVVDQFHKALADLIHSHEADEYWINTFLWEIYDHKVVQKKDRESRDLNMHVLKNEQPLNQILFGPAGTGKTYHTVNHALQIIDPDFYNAHKEPEKRDILKKEFQKYVDNGQIQFVTFHQSFSYEDFVEGIRVETKEELDKDGNILSFLEYPILPGVFKKICEKATIKNYSESDIEKIIRSFVDEISESEIVLETKTGVEFTVFSSSGKGGISVRTTTQNEIVISKKAIKSYLVDPSENIRKNQAYAWAVANYLKSRINSIEPIKEKSKRFIIIIDEINRGNISRIFGELITLIEESKRKGNTEELSTILPYSKKSFSVPNNLYILGTMNSSDRSLTGLDLALRRRFTFIEMAPNPLLLSGVEIHGIQIDRLLDILNQRIEILLDRDHCIGHAYFMPLVSIKDNDEKFALLKNIFQQKIIPLLQEYFFDDWKRIDAVLNENGMLKPKHNDSSINKLFKEPRLINCNVWEIKEDTFEKPINYIAIYEDIEFEDKQ